ncbi:Irregular chiasm C-roughest protein [Lepeophtheirus salmonis]|uniref:Irregular chiasm C-roughest protein n=1 Tax=Lepeophtheirus salmonis TaxID=72036 RepID=A0A7R8CNG9_LEPSM|nr:Irregular chiasm C-roughest protein [Lepeophtheirus salmonis]CAF2841830.1 Irregular chiasm C-roughest protein [Lepeophtheirus salmonis]
MSLRYCIYLLISSVCLLIPGSLSLTSPRSGTGEQSFIREPSDQIAIVGEHVTLPCRVVNKKGELQWTRDGFGLGVERNLTGFSRYHMIGSDEEDDWTLDINPVDLEDDAEFQCQVGAAENTPPIRSRDAVLTVLVPPSKPIIHPSGDFLRTVEGKGVEIVCESRGGKPAAEITWFDSQNEVVREGVQTFQELAEDGKRFNTKSILKFVAKAESHHEKNFTCQAQNSADRQPHSVSINLQVHYPPKVNLQQTDPMIKEGSSAKFSCNAHANPSQMSYNWYISGKLVPEAKKRDYIINSVDRRLHNAIIRCDVTNSIGKTVQAAKLNVSYPPLFLTRPESSSGSPGENVQLSCRVDSNPKALYQWYHKSFLVGHSENITIKVDERQTGEYVCKAFVPGYEDITASAMLYMKQSPHYSQRKSQPLIIKKIDEKDFGSYSCTVSNDLGEDTDIMHLRKRSALPLLVIMAAVIGGVILTIAVIMIVVLCRRSSTSSNKKLNNLLTIHRTVIKGNHNNNSSTSADEISNNSSEMNKVEVRTSSSLSQEECWGERSEDSYKNPPLSVSPPLQGKPTSIDVVDSMNYRDTYGSGIAHLNGGYTSNNASSSPLMKSNDNIFSSSAHPSSYYANTKYTHPTSSGNGVVGSSGSGYHHGGGQHGGFDYIIPPAQQSTPRSNSSSVVSNNINNLDNYCVYVNSTALLQPGLTATTQNVGKVSSLATHV